MQDRSRRPGFAGRTGPNSGVVAQPFQLPSIRKEISASSSAASAAAGSKAAGSKGLANGPNGGIGDSKPAADASWAALAARGLPVSVQPVKNVSQYPPHAESTWSGNDDVVDEITEKDVREPELHSKADSALDAESVSSKTTSSRAATEAVAFKAPELLPTAQTDAKLGGAGTVDWADIGNDEDDDDEEDEEAEPETQIMPAAASASGPARTLIAPAPAQNPWRRGNELPPAPVPSEHVPAFQGPSNDVRGHLSGGSGVKNTRDVRAVHPSLAQEGPEAVPAIVSSQHTAVPESVYDYDHEEFVRRAADAAKRRRQEEAERERLQREAADRKLAELERNLSGKNASTSDAPGRGAIWSQPSHTDGDSADRNTSWGDPESVSRGESVSDRLISLGNIENVPMGSSSAAAGSPLHITVLKRKVDARTIENASAENGETDLPSFLVARKNSSGPGLRNPNPAVSKRVGRDGRAKSDSVSRVSAAEMSVGGAASSTSRGSRDQVSELRKGGHGSESVQQRRIDSDRAGRTSRVPRKGPSDRSVPAKDRLSSSVTRTDPQSMERVAKDMESSSEGPSAMEAINRIAGLSLDDSGSRSLHATSGRDHSDVDSESAGVSRDISRSAAAARKAPKPRTGNRNDTLDKNMKFGAHEKRGAKDVHEDKGNRVEPYHDRVPRDRMKASAPGVGFKTAPASGKNPRAERLENSNSGVKLDECESNQHHSEDLEPQDRTRPVRGERRKDLSADLGGAKVRDIGGAQGSAIVNTSRSKTRKGKPVEDNPPKPRDEDGMASAGRASGGERTNGMPSRQRGVPMRGATRGRARGSSRSAPREARADGTLQRTNVDVGTDYNGPKDATAPVAIGGGTSFPAVSTSDQPDSNSIVPDRPARPSTSENAVTKEAHPDRREIAVDVADDIGSFRKPVEGFKRGSKKARGISTREKGQAMTSKPVGDRYRPVDQSSATTSSPVRARGADDRSKDSCDVLKQESSHANVDISEGASHTSERRGAAVQGGQGGSRNTSGRRTRAQMSAGGWSAPGRRPVRGSGDKDEPREASSPSDTVSGPPTTQKDTKGLRQGDDKSDRRQQRPRPAYGNGKGNTASGAQPRPKAFRDGKNPSSSAPETPNLPKNGPGEGQG
ncbi:hypothetical protein FVE85_0310 [Porphyridium purpureum]|uniref:Uncharacterized protein n=1 Tax=Porphyridium purpureum TaxID=35688 RepID=A0A5J4YY96_PORPP|nr:hypothetical protein FVE85_0310 [Porphyridium purpureum]|eukprot:POR5125..scf208_2